MLLSFPGRRMAISTKLATFVGSKRPMISSCQTRLQDRTLLWTRRHLSSSSSSEAGPFAARQQGAEERAKQMHNEIEKIMKKHDQKHSEEVQKNLRWAGFVEFLRNNKTNLSVIVVSFLTVVLSVKLVQGTQKYRELEQELKGAETKLVEQRQILKTLNGSSFQADMAKHCAAQLNDDTNGDALSTKKAWGWKTRGGSTSSGAASNSKEMEKILSTVFATDMNNLIGDAALNEDEKTVKELKELQDGTTIEKLSALSESAGSAEEAVKPSEGQEECVEDASGNKIVKKSVFRI